MPYLSFVPQPIHDLWRNEPGPLTSGKDRHPVAFASTVVRWRQGRSRKLGDHSTGRGAAPRSEFFGGFENVFVDVQGGSHRSIITHQTSYVKYEACLELESEQQEN